MKRLLILGLFATVALLIVRTRLPKVREQLEAHCEDMFERMPDTFPPKRAMNGIEEVRGSTARILELLEASRAGTVRDVA